MKKRTKIPLLKTELDTPVKKPRKQKQNAKTVTIDGHIFKSKAEADHYVLLKSDPDVYDLKPQPKFTLLKGFYAPSGEWIKGVDYVADFRYKRHSTPGADYVTEIKGQMKPDANIKIKFFMTMFPHITFQLLDIKGRDWRKERKAAQARKREKKRAAGNASAPEKRFYSRNEKAALQSISKVLVLAGESAH